MFSFSFFFFRSLLLVSFRLTSVDGILVFWVVRFVLVLLFLGFCVCYREGSILLFFLFSRRFAFWIVSGAGCCVVSWLSPVICCGLLISSLLFGFARFFSLRKTLDRRSTAFLLVAFVVAAILWAFCRPRGWCWGWVWRGFTLFGSRVGTFFVFWTWGGWGCFRCFGCGAVVNFTSISKKNIILMEREFSDIIYNNVDEPALPPRHRYTHTEEYQSPASDHSYAAKVCQKEESQELQVRTH